MLIVAKKIHSWNFCAENLLVSCGCKVSFQKFSCVSHIILCSKIEVNLTLNGKTTDTAINGFLSTTALCDNSSLNTNHSKSKLKSPMLYIHGFYLGNGVRNTQWCS